MKRERTVPRPVERRTGKADAQPMRAGPRHPRRPRGARDAAAVDQRGEEDALFGGRPVRADRVGGGGWGLVGFHPAG